MKITQTCCFAVVIATAACEENTSSKKTNQPAQPVATWEKLEEGIDLGKFPPPYADAVGRHAVWVVRVDCKKHKLVALAKSQFQHDSLTADAWATRHKLKLVINAGMFALDHSEHVGFFRIAGVDHSPKVHPEYQSVIAWDAPFSSLSMLDLDEPDKVGEIKKLTQKNLIQNLRLIKHPRENRWQQQPKRWSEAALGVDSKGRALFIFCSQGVSMHDLNNYLLALPIDLQAAQHLEGGPEASLFLKAGDAEIHCIGSYETGFNENDGNGRFWPLPNVIGIAE